MDGGVVAVFSCEFGSCVGLQINTPAQHGVICQLIEGTLHLLIQVIEKDTSLDWPQH